MQVAQHVGWTKTMRAKAETRRYASNLLNDIRAGKTSIDLAASNPTSRYALQEAFDIDPSFPDSLVEQSIVVLVPERIRASLN